jgi:hypothetical protein
LKIAKKNTLTLLNSDVDDEDELLFSKKNTKNHLTIPE